MTVSLITEGIIGGAAPDASPPTLTAVSPTPNVAPGSVGGMPGGYAAARVTPIVFSVTDTDGAANVAYIGVSMHFLDGSVETVYAGSNFVGEYVAGSSKSSIANGFQLSVARADGWPGAGDLSNLSVTLAVDAVDAGGNVTSATLSYQMPPTSPIAPTVPAEVVALGATDVAAAAIGRLISQLRSS